MTTLFGPERDALQRYDELCLDSIGVTNESYCQN
jgi:hypothetical protein